MTSFDKFAEPKFLVRLEWLIWMIKFPKWKTGEKGRSFADELTLPNRVCQ
jgi:hypothetical protein